MEVQIRQFWSNRNIENTPGSSNSGRTNSERLRCGNFYNFSQRITVDLVEVYKDFNPMEKLASLWLSHIEHRVSFIEILDGINSLVQSLGGSWNPVGLQ